MGGNTFFNVQIRVSIDTSLQPSGERIHYTYGLHRRCNSITGTCDYFPQNEDCHHDRYFCSMWRSVGFLMSFAIVIEGMTLIAYLVILAGGVQKRATGWKVLSGMLVLVGAVQLTSMSIMVRFLIVIEESLRTYNMISNTNMERRHICTITMIDSSRAGG